MIRNLLATTALATLIAGAAFAQEQPAPAPAAPAEQAAPVVKADGYLAANIIGENVYNGTGDNAENIGDVNDIVLDKDGKTESIIVGVGGFLEMGEHNVAVPFNKLSWAEANGDRWLVFQASKEQLQAMPEFDRRPYDPAPAPVASTDTGIAPAPTDTTAQAPAVEQPATEQPAAEQPAAEQKTAESMKTEEPAATDTTTTAAIDKSTLAEVPADKLMTEQDLVSTKVYGANDEHIGEISDVVMSQDGKVEAVIVDVGGFLGIGEKPVAIGFDKLSFMADKDGNKYLYTPFTKEQLDAQTAFDEASFAESRDKQLLIVQ
jgi:sporulation protein YlmC with PRC-barrel domain